MDKESIQPKEQPNNPLHGVKLATILESLVEQYGWERLAMEININWDEQNEWMEMLVWITCRMNEWDE